MNVLEIKNLCYVYSDGTPFRKEALKDFSVEIKKGEIVGVIGHTGSGKSTFMQLLNGLLKPTSGSILLDGTDIWEKPKEIRKVRFKVGLVFQYPEYQLFEDTVIKDISFGPKNMGLSEEEIRFRAEKAAKFVGLNSNFFEKSPFELSGGEKRRVAIAGVIAMDPEVLILDEPTAGLDPMGRNLLIEQILKYQKEKNNTVILVSHSMEDIAKVSDRVLVINNGQKVMFDNTRAVFSRARQLEDIGLKVPEITKIMINLKRSGYNVRDDILTVDEAVKEIQKLCLEAGN